MERQFYDMYNNWDTVVTYTSTTSGTKTIISTSSQYRHDNFKIRFTGNCVNGGDYLWIDNVNMRFEHEGFADIEFTWDDLSASEDNFQIKTYSVEIEMYIWAYDYDNNEWDNIGYINDNAADYTTSIYNLNSCYFDGNDAQIRLTNREVYSTGLHFRVYWLRLIS